MCEPGLHGRLLLPFPICITKDGKAWEAKHTSILFHFSWRCRKDVGISTQFIWRKIRDIAKVSTETENSNASMHFTPRRPHENAVRDREFRHTIIPYSPIRQLIPIPFPILPIPSRPGRNPSFPCQRNPYPTLFTDIAFFPSFFLFISFFFFYLVIGDASILSLHLKTLPS